MAEEIEQLSHRLKEEIHVGAGLEGIHMHPPHLVHLWFKVCLFGLVNHFFQLLACISKTTTEESHSML